MVGGWGGTTIVRFEPEIIIMLPFMLYIYCVQMQHVLARLDPLPEHPGHLLGEDGQDHEPCQQRLQGDITLLVFVYDNNLF